MSYLFDVNALLAFGFLQHEFSNRVAAWIDSQPSLTVATCSITEMGFLRILSGTQRYGVTVEDAKSLLAALKLGKRPRLIFIEDDQDLLQIPSWVIATKQVTDGHLLQLASTRSMQLATLDERIPGAYLIP
jgi:predicted nucleic acid-binding protein